MKIELEDIMFWMDAIRNSDDRFRTLESFWKGQLRSKVWLVEHLCRYNEVMSPVIVIHGGWNGVLASLLFNSELNPSKIISVDIDPACENIASTINKRQEMKGKFKSVTCNMIDYTYKKSPCILINTSVEHMAHEDYNQWLGNTPSSSLKVVQSNNYYGLDEHVNCSSSLRQFEESAGVQPIYRGQLETPLYTRYMLIGKKK